MHMVTTRPQFCPDEPALPDEDDDEPHIPADRWRVGRPVPADWSIFHGWWHSGAEFDQCVALDEAAARWWFTECAGVPGIQRSSLDLRRYDAERDEWVRIPRLIERADAALAAE